MLHSHVFLVSGVSLRTKSIHSCLVCNFITEQHINTYTCVINSWNRQLGIEKKHHNPIKEVYV